MRSRSDEIIEHANPHTIKKFELIEKYVEAWAHKLLQNQFCSGLVFIDCMSNSGEYVDDCGNQVFGTPVRVAKYLRNVAGQYPYKQIDLYFSDLCAARTDHLKGLLPNESRNFHFHITTEDGNELVCVENTNYAPAGQRSRNYPKHEDLGADLQKKKQENLEMYTRLYVLLKRVFECHDVFEQEYSGIYFNSGLPVDHILKTIKWLFIEQDIRYWNYSGRNMTWGLVPPVDTEE